MLKRLMSRLRGKLRPAHNLPAPLPALYARADELAEIERLLSDSTSAPFDRASGSGGGAGCLWLTGPAGQGKTWLALTVGYRLLASRRFVRVCWMGFADYSGNAPLDILFAALAPLIGSSQPAVVRRSLANTPTLLILDDVDHLAEPGRAEVLDALQTWLQSGSSRALLTAETLADAAAPHLELSPFSPAQAAEYLRGRGVSAELPSLPGHPLSLNLLAHALRVGPVEATDWAALPAGEQLGAAFRLALAGLEEKNRDWLPRLAPLRGGALEDLLLRATGYGQAARTDPTVSRGRQLAEAIASNDPLIIARTMGLALPAGVKLPTDAAQQILNIARQHSARLTQELSQAEQKLAERAREPDWPALKAMLLDTGLIEECPVAGYPAPYLRFHPGLGGLLAAYRKDAVSLKPTIAVYYEWARGLSEDPAWQTCADTRLALVRHELPNLLHCVGAALEAGAENAVSFATYLAQWLDQLGLAQERRHLEQRLDACRRQVRETQIALFGTHYQLKRHAQLIVAVVATIGKPENRANLETGLARMAENGWDALVTAIRRILDGERDAETLCAVLDSEDSVTVRAILEGIAQPATLEKYVAELQANPLDTPALALTPQQARLVVAIVAGLLQPGLQPQLEFVLKNMERKGWLALVAVVRRLQQGERGQDLGNDLEDDGQRLMVKCMLDGLANPESLRVLT